MEANEEDKDFLRYFLRWILRVAILMRIIETGDFPKLKFQQIEEIFEDAYRHYGLAEKER